MIEDDGVGFTEPSKDGIGLIGMRERVGLLDGRLEIESRPNQGTTIVAEVPLGAGAQNKKGDKSESLEWGHPTGAYPAPPRCSTPMNVGHPNAACAIRCLAAAATAISVRGFLPFQLFQRISRCRSGETAATRAADAVR